MNALEVLQKQKIIQRHIVEADASGALPDRIEILRAGTWPASSNKGPLEITVVDLAEMKANFEAGVGVPGQGQTGLPIDFMHEDFAKAAGWMTQLTIEGDVLYATVEWSQAGRDAVLNKEFKCVSPSFYPACLGQWTDPENADITARNVLVGAGLTNIPFFKDLKPIMASNNSPSSAEDNIIYIASEKETRMPTLEDVLNKDTALDENDKAVLVEANNKGELTAEQQEKYGFEVTRQTTESKKVESDNKIDAATKQKIEAAAVEAYKKSLESNGQVVVDASRIEKLEASNEEIQKERAGEFVDTHIKRGAIKADARDLWVDKLVKADKDDREFLEAALKNMKDDPAMTGKQGGSNGVEVSATEEIDKLANEKIEAATKSGQTLSYGDAVEKVLKEKPELEKQRQAEVTEAK